MLYAASWVMMSAGQSREKQIQQWYEKTKVFKIIFAAM
jgi:hypothetical protein